MTALADHIVIIGAMGAGKTTVGTGIAHRLDLGFVDSDDQIRALTGSSGARIAETEGVAALHLLELQVFWDALASPHPTVIAAAASVIEDEAARSALLEVNCVWVDAEDELLRLRQASGSHRREVGEEEADRLERREPLFSHCADVRVDTGVVSEHDAVSLAVEAIRRGDDE
ncbi:MAG: AAA family ATPase [Actinomycetota bacterium]|nr:AAA family ATPase [Actinomycetota bacterium]